MAHPTLSKLQYPIIPVRRALRKTHTDDAQFERSLACPAIAIAFLGKERSGQGRAAHLCSANIDVIGTSGFLLFSAAELATESTNARAPRIARPGLTFGEAHLAKLSH